MTSRALRLIVIGLVLTACQATAIQPTTAPATNSLATPSAVAVTPAATASPTARPTPAPTARPTPAPTPPPATAFALNLYRDGDFVPQHTFEWCVGASIQMASNMVVAETRSSFEDQQALWELARSHSTNSFRGANPRGWATALKISASVPTSWSRSPSTTSRCARRRPRSVRRSGRSAWSCGAAATPGS